MALGTNFNGAKLDKNLINSDKYAILVCNASDYTRGELFTDGSDLYLLGIVDASAYTRSPDKVLPIGSNDAAFSRKAEFNATVYASVTEKALQELEDSKIVAFVVDANKLTNLDGFLYTAADFTSINGIMNAEFVFYNVFAKTNYTAKGGEVTQFEFNLNVSNEQDLSEKVFQDEPVGTFLSYWDWTSSSSLVDSVNSVTLTTVGAAVYDTDHYDCPATAGLLLSNFSESNVVDPSNSNIYCIFLDFLSVSPTANKYILDLLDNANSEIRIRDRTTAGLFTNPFDADGDTGGLSYTTAITARSSIMLYYNFEKNLMKVILSSGENARTRPIDADFDQNIGGFTGANNDLYLALDGAAGDGSDCHFYKFGVSS